MAPQQMPGAPPSSGTQGGDIAGQLMQLVQPILASPKGQMMAKALMAQMGGQGGQAGAMPPDPTQAAGGGYPSQMRGANTMGRGPVTDSELGEMEQAEQEMIRPNLPPKGVNDAYSAYSEDMPEDTNQTPKPMSTEDELAMAQQMMGQSKAGSMDAGTVSPSDKGGMNQGQAPTQQEIEMLKSRPTDMNCSNFDKLFGAGASARILGGDPTGPNDPAIGPQEQEHMGRTGQGYGDGNDADIDY